MTIESINAELRAIQQEGDAITKKAPLTTPDRTRFEFLMSKAATLRSQLKSLQTTDVQRLEKLREVERELGIDANTGNASAELRCFLNGETRTYSALTTTSTGALIPTEFEYQLVQTAMAAGPLVAGSTVCSEIKTPTGGPRKMPMTDDLSNQGFVHSESTPVITEAEMTLGQVSMGCSAFDSGILLMSRELSEDANWTTGQQVLQKSLGARLGRIQNKTFLAALLTQLAGNSSASVVAAGSSIAYGDTVNLVSSVNAQYRSSDKTGFLMNSSTQKALGNLLDTAGRPIFRHILAQKPSLHDYPVYVSDFADSIASGKNPILFGDWSYVFIRHIPGTELLTLTQRYAEQGSVAFIGRKRADLQYAVPSTADSAIKILHFA